MIRITSCAAAVAGVVVAVSAGLSAHASTGAKPPAPAPAFWMSRPCPAEDSVNCYWNAGSEGNGSGHSFYVRWLNGHGANGLVCVFYAGTTKADRAYAQEHDYCS